MKQNDKEYEDINNIFKTQEIEKFKKTIKDYNVDENINLFKIKDKNEMLTDNMIKYLSILGLSKDASMETVRKQYRILVRY